jgi:hypothetical protein
MTSVVPWEVATVMLPVTFSEAVGLKDTFIDALLPAPSVTGIVIPLTAKFLAFTVI